ncbi:MAG: hypothetical protein KC800_32475, partial [Candidatus Eremiobacteraeota bacterium]|nr:hypothetical protein [Candidatus Eremiobacteraeota bacterium]
MIDRLIASTDPRTRRVIEKSYKILARNRVRVARAGAAELVFTTPSLSDGAGDSHLDYGGKQWLWDSAAHAMNLAHSEPAVACAELRAMMEFQNTEHPRDYGFVPHMNYFQGDGQEVPTWVMDHFNQFLNGPEGSLVTPDRHDEFRRTYWSGPTHSDITQPPILAMAVLEVCRAVADPSFAREMLPRLKAYYDYLGRRRADSDGLLRIIHPWESGWDNSQRWDDAIGLRAGRREVVHRADIDRLKVRLFSKYKALEWDLDRILDLRDFLVKPVDFNTLYAKNLECLSRLCDYAGDDSGAAAYSQLSRKVSSTIFQVMWDGDKYVDIVQSPSGDRISTVKSAAMFYPMMLEGEPYSGRLIHEHLCNPSEFNPPSGYMVPTTSLDDPTFDGAQYWRGNVWGIVNFFVHCGVRKHLEKSSDDQTALGVAAKIRDSMFELLDRADFYEYFHPAQIDGEPRGYGVPSFGWNGLA